MDKVRTHNLVIAIVVILFFWWLLTSCRVKTVFVPVHSTTTVTERVRDTIIDVQLVPYRDSVSVRDTVSRLENEYAYSNASWSDGVLSHSLGIKEGDIKTKVKVVEVFHTDSVPVPYPVDRIVEKNVLRWWQECLMWAGVVALAYVLICIINNWRRR
ncbi:MAG: hypothetical protein PUB21_08040 [Bacteroidales bacterium]|nr:hypothetical protein [Bacteroidales bacterium]